MVKISGPAVRDLRQIYDYIARDSVHYAREVIRTILEHIESIEPFPRRGRVVPEIQNDDIREIFVYSYRIIYRISDSIEIAAVIHARREFNKSVNDRLS